VPESQQKLLINKIQGDVKAYTLKVTTANNLATENEKLCQ